MLEQAKELERLYWQNPDSEMEGWVFSLYTKAGAFDAARRFYVESRENFLDSVKIASGVGTCAYVLGYLKNDATLRKLALEDSASASYNDMLLGIWDAAIRDDRDELQLRVDELIERYEGDDGPEAVGKKIKRFLRLLPALEDPKHPQHQTATHYFRNYLGAVIVRWIWIEKFKMSKEDAIEFLGGKEADAIRHVLVCYLEGDAEKTRVAADAFINQDDARLEQCVLAKFISLKLATDSKEPAVPDLKPARVTSARAAVLARIAEKVK
jgi:hypothetical protein